MFVYPFSPMPVPASLVWALHQMIRSVVTSMCACMYGHLAEMVVPELVADFVVVFIPGLL